MDPTHIPDRPNQCLNTLDLCFTTTPSSYKYTIFPPIGNSDHNLMLSLQQFHHALNVLSGTLIGLIGGQCAVSLLTIIGVNLALSRGTLLSLLKR